jgi:ribosome maturation factor RimP
LVSVELGRKSKWARAHFFVGGNVSLEMDRIRDAAERAARSAGVEVVDVEWKVGKQRFLRVFIDKPFGGQGQPPFAGPGPAQGKQEKPEGVSHSDCRAVSEQLSVLLDVEDLVPGSQYILEVSSPGLDRKLTRPAEFERFAGRKARISMTEPVEGQAYFEGRLAGYADGRVKIDVQGRMMELPLAGIRKAQLVVEL